MVFKGGEGKNLAELDVIKCFYLWRHVYGIVM